MKDNDEFLTVSSVVTTGFYAEKRSKFYSFAHHVVSEDDVKQLLESYRRKYHDARHVCFAYMLGSDYADYRLNDDGEPSGTAGKPILGQINRLGLTNVLVVVVRYYGGVNLGTGGLIVAYRTAAAEALEKAETVTEYVYADVSYDYPYDSTNNVMRVVKEMSAKVLATDYGNDGCTIHLRIRRSLAEELKEKLESTRFS